MKTSKDFGLAVMP